PALPAGCWQLVLVPSQASVVQGLPSSAHGVPLGCVASAGQSVFVPSQLSATSQSPAAARHSVPALPAGCWQVALVPSQASVVQGIRWAARGDRLGCAAGAGLSGVGWAACRG